MPTTRDIFLKRKLTLLAVIGTGVGLLLACGAVMYGAMQASVAENLSTVARVVAAQSRNALSAKNPAIVRALIDILPAAPAIASAAIYTDDGVVVASYLRDQKEAPIPPMPATARIICC